MTAVRVPEPEPLHPPAHAHPPALILDHGGGVVRASGMATYRSHHGAVDAGATRGSGVFFEWSWDGLQLDATTDRYGFHPAFVFEAPGRVGVSPSVAALLDAGAPPELDDAALAVFLRLGYFIGDDTAFRAIRAIPPGACLSWRDGRLDLRSTGRAPVPAAFAGSRDEALERYGALFQQAVERLVPAPGERAAVPLSGGRDSRHVLYALCRAGAPPVACITARHYPPRPDEDVRVAGAVTAALGIEHHVLPCEPDRLGAELRKNIATGYCADEHAWFLPLASHVRREGYDVLYDGIAGDVLSAALHATPERHHLFATGAFRALAEQLLGEEGHLVHLLPGALYRRWSRSLAAEHLAAELARHADAPHPVGQFYFWNRTRREVALVPWGLLAGRARVLAPFLDDAVYDHLASLPASLVLDRAFHTEAIHRFYPEHAHLAFECSDARSSTDLSAIRAFVRGLLRLLARGGTRAPLLLRRRYVAPRLLRALAEPGYAIGIQPLGVLTAYLLQLGALTPGTAAP